MNPVAGSTFSAGTILSDPNMLLLESAVSIIPLAVSFMANMGSELCTYIEIKRLVKMIRPCEIRFLE